MKQFMTFSSTDCAPTGVFKTVEHHQIKHRPPVNRTRKLCYSKDPTVSGAQPSAEECKHYAIFLCNTGNEATCIHVFLYFHKETLKIHEIEKWLPLREKIDSLFNVVMILESDEE